MDVLFLGSGVSTGVPKIGCIVRPDAQRPHCPVCLDALETPGSKNRRNNVSILIRVKAGGSPHRHVMVDCGKTMRDAALRHLAGHGVRSLDALLLTHAHADAILGLDDVRDFSEQHGGPLPWDVRPLPVYLSGETFEGVRGRFPYLVPGKGNPLEAERKKEEEKTQGEARENRGGGRGRTVSRLDYRLLGDGGGGGYEPLDVEGVRVTPLPVLHGGDYECLGFEFSMAQGGGGDRFVYLSDVSRIPERIMSHILRPDAASPRVLVIDALKRTPHFSHFSLDEALEAAREIRADQTWLVGMTCSIGDHDEVNEELRAWGEREGLRVALAHDGLMLRSEDWAAPRGAAQQAVAEAG